jgi:hypothetical protein
MTISMQCSTSPTDIKDKIVTVMLQKDVLSMNKATKPNNNDKERIYRQFLDERYCTFSIPCATPSLNIASKHIVIA